MTYKTAQREGKKNAVQHRKPNTTHCITACTGPTATSHFRYLKINFANFRIKSI